MDNIFFIRLSIDGHFSFHPLAIAAHAAVSVGVQIQISILFCRPLRGDLLWQPWEVDAMAQPRLQA